MGDGVPDEHGVFKPDELEDEEGDETEVSSGVVLELEGIGG